MEKGLLYFMNGNLQMAKLSTKHLIEISPDERMRASLLEDLHALDKFENAIRRIQGTDKIKGLSDMAQSNTEMAIDMKTFMNKSPEKMAGMLADGYEKGISSIYENIRRHPDEREDVKELANGYLMFLKQTHAKYKGF